jgi:hypothetical protein
VLNIHLVDIEDEFNLLLVFQKYEPNGDQLFNIMIHKMLNFAIRGAGTAHPSEDLNSPQAFTGVRFTRSLVLCVCFVDRCLSFCSFSFGH